MTSQDEKKNNYNLNRGGISSELHKDFNKLNLDCLKDICKENSLTGYSSLKKNDLIHLIFTEYNKRFNDYSRLTRDKLEEINGEFKLINEKDKPFSNFSKDFLVHIIVTVFIKNSLYYNNELVNIQDIKENIDNKIKFEIEEKIKQDKIKKEEKKLNKTKNTDDTGVVDMDIDTTNINSPIIDSSSNVLTSEIDILKKKLSELESKLSTGDVIPAVDKKNKRKDNNNIEPDSSKENTINDKNKSIPKDETKKNKKEKEKSTKKNEVIVEEVNTNVITIVDKDIDLSNNNNISEVKKDEKNKKQAIPKSVRTSVWNHYIGEYINQHRCLCCKKVLISNTNFDVGHVISEKDGGTHEINNLRPICSPCNHSMGSENMIEFVKKYGYYIG